MKNLFIILSLIIGFGVVIAQISPENQEPFEKINCGSGWYYITEISGNESLYNITCNDIYKEKIKFTEVCLEANFSEKEVSTGILSSYIYEIPTFLPYYKDGKEVLPLNRELIKSPTNVKDKFEEGDIYKFCFEFENDVDEVMKIGESSITIVQLFQETCASGSITDRWTLEGGTNQWDFGGGGDSGWCLALNVDDETNMTTKSSFDMTRYNGGNLSFDWDTSGNFEAGEYLQVFIANDSLIYINVTEELTSATGGSRLINFSEYFNMSNVSVLNVRAQCINNANNEKCLLDNIFAWGWDSLSPSVNIIHPEEDDSFATGEDISFNLTVSDASPLTTCWWTTDFGVVNNTISEITSLSGADAITNGDFSGAGSWDEYGNCLIGAGVMNCTDLTDPGLDGFTQTTNMDEGLNQVNFTVVQARGAVTLKIYYENGTLVTTVVTELQTLGEHSYDIDLPSSESYIINFTAIPFLMGSPVAIDDVKVKAYIYSSCANTTIDVTDVGDLNLTLYANDTYDNIGFDTINISIPLPLPIVSFEAGTPEDSSSQSGDSIFVNVSAVSQSEDNVSVFIDFDTSLVSWWRMDDTDGNTVIDYMGKNNGTKVDDAHQIDEGYFGKAFEFDGAGDYITVADSSSLDISTEITISAWFNNSVPALNDPLVCKWTGGEAYCLDMGFPTSDNIGFFIRQGGDNKGATTVNNYNDSYWHHVVGVFNGSNVLIYIDGDKEAVTGDAATSINVGGASLSIGAYGSAGGFFNGQIDDVMIFNRSLSPEEVIGLYGNQTSKYLSNNFEGLTLGAHTFQAFAQDDIGVRMTETRTVTLVANTCTCAGLNTNWEINMSHGCNITTGCELGTGTLNFTLGDLGYANCSANINTTNFGRPNTDGQIFWIAKDCLIEIK